MDSLLQFSDLTERLSDFNYNTDANNNNNADFDTNSSSPAIIIKDKYSLRPRSVRRITEPLKHQLSDTQNNDNNSNNNSRTNNRQNKLHKQKQKAAPLSKYRRKTANARERNRMREINQAFETLRQVIPHMQASQMAGSNEKLTKITTLRLAMKYISTLSAALNGGPTSETEPLSDYSDLDCLLLESDGESLPLSDHSLLASPDFPESSLSPVDFGDPSLPALLHTDFTEHALDTTDFSEFLLT